jgi:outer membrane protein assembly factor BamE (lipoprotein component of BamABCDE complex)
MAVQNGFPVVYRGLFMKKMSGALAMALALTLGLTACDQQKVAKLEEGLSTEADVRKQFGEPVTVVKNADGSMIMEYPRQPEGQANYFITIGSDGKMSSLRQVLTPANFEKIKPGMEKTEVRNILGRSAKATPYALKQEEVWDWYFMDGQQKKEFNVTFSLADGKVINTAVRDDMRESTGGGPSSK